MSGGISETNRVGAFEDRIKENEELLGNAVPITFNTPDGSIKHTFHMGQEIMVLKAWLEENKGIAFADQTLYLNDRPLPDPMSLSDLPFKAGEENVVTVKVT